MRLRIATTVALLTGLIMILAWPIIVGPKPADALSLHAQRTYAAKMGLYLILTVGAFVVAATMAVLLARRARDAYRTEAQENLRMLIDSTLEAHKKKQQDDPKS